MSDDSGVDTMWSTYMTQQEVAKFHSNLDLSPDQMAKLARKLHRANVESAHTLADDDKDRYVYIDALRKWC
jgi:hypothetical protein